MSENPTAQKPLPTIWRVPDELWEKIEPILSEHDPPKATGRPRVDQRAALDAIIFRMRSGCQWNQMPKGEFPDDSSVHRTFQRWVEMGVLGSLAESTSSSRLRTGRWARLVLGGSRRPEPH